MSYMLQTFVALLIVHWVADFILQTHWQASNKSKNWNALLRHVCVYTLTLGMASFALFESNPRDSDIWLFVGLNGAFHFVTDAFTSRWTAALYAKQDWHNFFVIVGFDQLIHQFTLAFTLWWIIYHGVA